MSLRASLMLALVVGGGCSTGITAPSDAGADLSAAASDLSGGCSLAFGGDVSLTVACDIFLCHQIDIDQDDLDLSGAGTDPSMAHAILDVAGTFAVRSYTRADLRGVDVGVTDNGKHYAAGGANGTASVTITGVSPPTNACNGVAHGAAQASLVEIVADDAGAPSVGPGRVTLAATF
ncbi:MAG: hypothetical protein ACXVDD_29850 [Polyangia bacterium]